MSNVEWYDIDIKNEVLEAVHKYLEEKKIDGINIIIKEMSKSSVRNLMEPDNFKLYVASENKEEFITLVTKVYFAARSRKYGQKCFWNAAKQEREIGYEGKWSDFLKKMILDYVGQQGKVLIVGTADGSEISMLPTMETYAMDQIESSVKAIVKDVIPVHGDFEDDKLIVKEKKYFDVIIALRCMMPNTRLGNFFKFVRNNIKNKGFIILSHPLSYLNKNGVLENLENSSVRLKEFELRLKELTVRNNVEIIGECKTKVEHFYILKLGEL
jgi:hypothetical protein